MERTGGVFISSENRCIRTGTEMCHNDLSPSLRTIFISRYLIFLTLFLLSYHSGPCPYSPCCSKRPSRLSQNDYRAIQSGRQSTKRNGVDSPPSCHQQGGKQKISQVYQISLGEGRRPVTVSKLYYCISWNAVNLCTWSLASLGVRGWVVPTRNLNLGRGVWLHQWNHNPIQDTKM